MKSNMESGSHRADDVSVDEWEAVAETAEQLYAKQVEKASGYATDFYKEALGVEKDFNRRRQEIESEGGEMGQKEFEKWEDALSGEIGYAERELKKTDWKLETIAKCEESMFFSADETELQKTIEAQAGKFYHQRMDALRKAIQSSEDKEAQEDLDYARSFYVAVMNHLDYKYMTPEDIRKCGYEEYEDGRTYAHNAAIKHLNGLNSLAKKYHVRPFMVRNLWPSSLREKDKQTPEVANVMRYDRHLAEAYYTIAFSSEDQRRKNVQERQKRLGLF